MMQFKLLRTLYAKLVSALVLLLLSIGLIYALVSVSATRHYMEEVSQKFNRDLASKLVMDRNLVEEGRLKDDALKATFMQYMVINPSIEIYLLDMHGNILSYSADPGKVKRKSVSLLPIEAFLSGDDFPVLGDDPRSHDRLKAFSVTAVPSAEAPEGYLYVVLQGEEYDSVNKMIAESYFLRLGSWTVAGSLLLGLLMGLLLFYLLTRRLQRLALIMEGFRESNFLSHIPYTGRKTLAVADEVDRLGITFDQMAGRIITQIDSLKEQDSLRRELVAQVSHDLRTPLASLHGYLETLQLKEESLSVEERREYLAVALRHSERLGRLVSELFELAKLDAKETKPNLEPFHISELVHDVVQKFQLRAEESGVRLLMEMSDDIPFVSADIGFIERVLENLIVNALKHTEQGGEVNIALHVTDDRVSVRIVDTGHGIPEQDLPHIFQPFYQAGNQHRGNEHVGLGLAIVKRILDLHDSDIKVSSQLGQGTSFTFSLPLWSEVK